MPLAFSAFMLSWRMRHSDAKVYKYIVLEHEKFLQKVCHPVSRHQEDPAAYQMAEFAWKIFTLPLIMLEHLPNDTCLRTCLTSGARRERQTDRDPEFCFSVILICSSDTLVWRMTHRGHCESVCECVSVCIKVLWSLLWMGKQLLESVMLHTLVLGSPIRPETYYYFYYYY